MNTFGPLFCSMLPDLLNTTDGYKFCCSVAFSTVVYSVEDILLLNSNEVRTSQNFL